MSTTTKKTSMKGKRYTDAQKKEVVDFVEKYNSENSRGGQSAAAGKFGVSQLTVATWLKSSGSPSASKKGRAAKAPKASKAAKAPKAAKYGKKAAATGGGINAKLSALLSLGNQIEKTEKELNGLKAKFNSIKASL